MYVEQFWRYFEQSGDINTYLGLKKYEKLYMEHTKSAKLEVEQDSHIADVDRMN